MLFEVDFSYAMKSTMRWWYSPYPPHFKITWLWPLNWAFWSKKPHSELEGDGLCATATSLFWQILASPKLVQYIQKANQISAIHSAVCTASARPPRSRRRLVALYRRLRPRWYARGREQLTPKLMAPKSLLASYYPQLTLLRLKLHSF